MSHSSESGSNFSLAWLFLDAERRRALSSVYAFCREVDDIADSGAFPPDEARRRLDEWRAEVGRVYAGRPGSPLAARLAEAAARYRLPQQAFLDVVGGVELDLVKSRYKTFEELEAYLHGVAVAVGLLCVEIFGHEHTPPGDLREYARNTGYAFQLTNIMRDVGSDLERGRIYLPLSDLASCGCSEAELVNRRFTPAFRAVMNVQYERAKTFYRRSRNLLHPVDRAAMTPAYVMAEVYEALLDQIKAGDYRVFFQRAGLPAWRKAWLAGAGWAHAHGLF